MKMQIASLFAKMGFEVDTSSLDRVEKTIKDVRASSALLTRNLRAMNTQLNKSAGYLSKIAKADGTGASIKTLGNNYTVLGANVNNAREKTLKFGRTLSLIDPRIDKSVSKIELLSSKYADLTSKIAATNAAISQTKVISARQPSLAGTGVGRGGYVTNRTLVGRDQGYFNNSFGAAGGFLRSFLPAGGLLAGGAISAGAAVAEVKKRGQAQMAMEQALMFSSKGMEDFNDSLKFVKSEALRLGMSSQDLGRTFGQINLASSLSKGDKKKLITDTSEVITTLKLSKVDQGLIWYAVNQMFSLGKMQGEEIRQLTERGISKTLLYNAIKQAYGVKSQDEALKLQEAGKLDPNKVLPLLFAEMNKMAHKSGAYSAAMQASITQQNIFVEKLNQGAADLMKAGLDELLANIFKILAKGIPILNTFAKGLIAAGKGVFGLVKAVKDFIVENPLFLGVFSGLTLAVALFTGKILAGTTAFGVFANTFIRLLPLMGAAMKRVPLIAMFTALWYLFKAYEESLSGKNNWLTFLGDLIVLAGLKVENLMAKIRLLTALITNGEFAQALSILWNGLDVDGTNTDVNGKPKKAKGFLRSLIPFPDTDMWKDFLDRRSSDNIPVNGRKVQLPPAENYGQGVTIVTNNIVPKAELTVNIKDAKGNPISTEKVMLPLNTGGSQYINGRGW